MEIIIAILYTLSLFYIFLFGLSQFHLTYLYRKEKKKGKRTLPSVSDYYPSVTIQLPVYNEMYVVERLLDAVDKIDYDFAKLEIQILDDSTDDTSSIIQEKLKTLTRPEIFKHIRRVNRNGFKAGALQHGLRTATGEFIAIFDADFVPEPDFLIKAIPYFSDEEIGVIQTRWGHLNKNFSLLTQLQAFGLDAHFSIEQAARNASGSFINFNGTCGIWRKKCIEDSGGWSADTLTEDLDLSYRAQLKGWKFKYLEDVCTPGELPVIMPAIKSQQYRWNKGGAETARKHFGNVLRSKAPLLKKVHAFFHLFNSSVFICVLSAAILSIPMLYLKNRHPYLETIFNLGVVFLLGFLSITYFYWTATQRFYRNSLSKFVTLFPPFLIVSMGLSLHNGLAVLEGMLGRKTPFIRTPKFNVINNKAGIKTNIYIENKFNILTFFEGVLTLYFISGIALGVLLKDPSLMFFHGMLAIGFGFVFFYSVRPLGNE